ncbi:MAG: PIG-L family deacetylase [Cyclobacteriaceae bacterium]
MKLITTCFVSLLIFGLYYQTSAQAPKKPNAAEIQLAIKKLQTLGSVLYIAAHPDDENTRLIAYLANEKLMRTGYLSVTRGDGGQNLVGPEIREKLGLIRTQELLQARRTDGGEQFFTRANDFGYSKTADETFQIWDKEKILGDVVWVIRKFRPDFLITRFPPDHRARHGQHTASAVLAEEAFDAAGDPSRFSEQLKFVKPWQPQALMFNTFWWFYGSQEAFDTTGLLPVDVGAYNSLLGKSYTEIAALSSSMHKSQGFGRSGSRGSNLEYLDPVKGDSDGFLDHSQFTWDSVPGGTVVQQLLQEAYDNFDAEEPAAIVPQLIEAYQAMEGLQEDHWKYIKQKDVKEVINACLGLFIEAVSEKPTATPGTRVGVKIETVNRSNTKVKFLSYDNVWTDPKSVSKQLNNNARHLEETYIDIPQNAHYSQPYWLQSPGSLGMFAIPDQHHVGKPENGQAVTLDVLMEIEGVTFGFNIPLIYKKTDPVKGEIYEPLHITPPVFLNFGHEVLMFANATPKALSVVIKAGKDSISGDVTLSLPDGWKSEPEDIGFTLLQQGAEQTATFNIYAPEKPGEGNIEAVAHIDGRSYDYGLVDISYDHIPRQRIFPQARLKVVKLDIEKKGEQVGYIMGAGDAIPESLRQIDYQVDILDEENLSQQELQSYDAIILGVRALNTIDRLKYEMPKLLEYVKMGGNLIVQYNTSSRLVTDNFAPYPIKVSRDRVAVEEAPVAILEPEHPLLNAPNKITQDDFKGWVQERGLYFPNEWDAKYTALLSSQDPGEDPKNGGLLVAKYGKGHYIYTGYSWFRELPAGVPGAYRIFANLISAGK